MTYGSVTVTLARKTGREKMATSAAARPISMEAFVEKQARGDAVVNIVLAGGINYWLTRDLAFVPAGLPLGDDCL